MTLIFLPLTSKNLFQIPTHAIERCVTRDFARSPHWWAQSPCGSQRDQPELPCARHATTLYRLGASDAIPETIEASLQLAETVLVDIGVPMGFVIASIHERRDEFRKILQPTEEAARARQTLRRRRLKIGRAEWRDPEAEATKPEEADINRKQND